MRIVALLAVAFFAVTLFLSTCGVFGIFYNIADRNGATLFKEDDGSRRTFWDSFTLIVFFSVFLVVSLSCGGWSLDGLRANWKLLFN